TLAQFRQPLVLDADALNLISEHPEILNSVPPHSILTPHPKEFERLFGASANDFERSRLQCDMAQKYQVVIVLKGAHTAVALPDGQCWFNSSGNPGMATAGSGDVLTGIITGLLAQGYAPEHAALLGVWLHGRAADLAVESSGRNHLIASDLINNFHVSL
ncbi:MAG: NAD(P)H-hydrate dehydratase, partial [Saprospiraceae bacterium]|nr:NAD(P)H-hydrate dehydratase [Saprospiraceae bacterium]